MARPHGYQEHWAPPTSQQLFSTPDECNAQENTSPEPWSREPELGSWSPVFNHNDGSFLTLQKDLPASSLFADNGVDYPGNQQAVGEPSTNHTSQQLGMAMVPAQDHSAPNKTSQQELLSSSAHSFANNSTFYPSNQQTLPSSVPWQVSRATAPSQDHRTTTMTSQYQVPASSAQLFPEGGGFYPSNQQVAPEPSLDFLQQVGMPVVPAQDLEGTSVTSQQELLSSPAHLFANNSSFYPTDQQVAPEAESLQQVGMEMGPPQDHKTPTVTSQQDLTQSSAHLLPNNSGYYPTDQQVSPETESLQQGGMGVAPPQDHKTPTVTSQQDLTQSSAHLFANNSGYYPTDQQVAPETESLQQGGMGVAPPQDHRTPTVTSQQDLTQSSAHWFANNSSFYPTDQQVIAETESLQQGGMGMAPPQDHGTPTVMSQRDLTQSSAHLLADNSSFFPTDQQVAPETESAHLFGDNITSYQSHQQAPPQQSTDFFQQGGMAAGPGQDRRGPTMTSQQVVPSSSGQLFADNTTIYGSDQQVTTETKSFQQVGMTMAPVQDHGGPTVTSQQVVPSSSGQLFADNNTIYGRDQHGTTEAESLHQVGMTTAPVQDHGVPTVTSQQAFPSSSRQLFADNNTIYGNGQHGTTETESFHDLPVGMTMAPVQDHGVPTITSQQVVPSSAGYPFADNPSNQKVIPAPSDGMAMGAAQDYNTPIAASQQAVVSSSGHLFVDSSIFNPSNQYVIPGPSAGLAVAPDQDYNTPTTASQQVVPSSAGHLFADNSAFNPSNQHVIPGPSAGMAMAPVASSSAQFFAEDGFHLNDQQALQAPSDDPMKPVMDRVVHNFEGSYSHKF